MKTSEMIAMLEKNPKLKFQYNTGSESGVMSCIDGDIKLIEHNGKPANYSQYLILHSGYMRQDWQLVREPVSWQEAIQAWIDGKEIEACECEGCGNGGSCGVMGYIKSTPNDTSLHANCRQQFKTAKWYIND